MESSAGETDVMTA